MLTQIAPGGGSDESASYTVHVGRRGPPPEAHTPGRMLQTLYGFSPEGTRYLAEANLTGEPARKHHLFETAADAVVTTFERPPGGYYLNACTWCFKPDGRELYVVATRRLLRYDCATGGQPVALATLPQAAVRASSPLAAHPDGRLLATVEDGSTVTFRDAESLEVVRSYDFAMPTVTCVAFTPDGTRCVIGNSRGKVLLFDVE